MTCPVCGVSQKDRAILVVITELPGTWELTTHQGHIVKIAKKKREMTVDQALEEYATLLTTSGTDVRIAQTE